MRIRYTATMPVLALVAALSLSACNSSDSDSNETDPTSSAAETEYGIESQIWFTLSAGACETSDSALSLYNLTNEFDLSSELFSCTQYNYGSEVVYSIEWAGDDLDGDGSDDTLSFDLTVEAFEGSTYSYSDTVGESSVTELGTATNLYYVSDDNDTADDDSDDFSYWDIGDDNASGISAGQSLHLSISNLSVSAEGYEANITGFNSINLAETAGGRDHKHIRGLGGELNSGTFDTNGTTSASVSFEAQQDFYITGAGDYYENLVWSVTDIEFSLSIANPALEAEPNWLAGSWGVAHLVDGGYKLDSAADTTNYVAGAEQIVENLPEAGHVITFFTGAAHPHVYTLREHPYIDIANDIHVNMVPSLENEQIILDVIDTFRAADKKVILYLNAAGPDSNLYNDTLAEIADAWVTYYTDEWDGDEGAAWRTLVKGFAERFDGLVDGYWFDNAENIPGGTEAFIQVFREINPDLLLCLNKNKQYHSDDNGDDLYVDSDGLDDDDDTDYKVIKWVPTNAYDDYSCGHVTPLGQGAPPNSFGYEEYTIPAMVDSPTASYDGYKDALKHGWFPIRERWHVANVDLVFETEQAYRFTRTITDAGAGMTWSNTQVDGYMSADEMTIMQAINDRMAQQPMADYEAYERPEGACYLGECE